MACFMPREVIFLWKKEKKKKEEKYQMDFVYLEGHSREDML